MVIEKGEDGERELKEYVRDDETKIAFTLGKPPIVKPPLLEDDIKPDIKSLSKQSVFQSIKKEIDEHKRPTSSKQGSSSLKRSALDEIMAEEEMFKEKRNRKDYWLRKGIIVKVVLYELFLIQLMQ
jgi:hypothetical protein